MSKAPGGAEKKEPQGQQGAKPEGGAGGGGQKAAAPTSGSKSKWSPAPGGCFSFFCKSNANRFNFCDEHFDQFKFGLIKKTGEPVPDYEKKFEHYQAFKRRTAQKAA